MQEHAGCRAEPIGPYLFNDDDGSFLVAPRLGLRSCPLASARTSLRRWLRLGDHPGQQISKALTGRTRAPCQFGHLGKTQLGVGERQSALGLACRMHEVVELGLVTDLHAAPFEQHQLAIERAQSNPQRRQDLVSAARVFSQQGDQLMKSRCTRQSDMNRRTPPRIPGAGHGLAFPMSRRRGSSKRSRRRGFHDFND